ncbi:protein CotJA [Alicyclobacillus cellulosilyticus]|uniref:Protein CotJA n=1 Tax=Alicyclobacillus cellulosilyticus TaxID=1003997 RepID=A0A917KDR2_9BACL|nr:spore coat associated protein CotJA [Alicyclobacillus cellulosilyticus]GGJ09632.1 protein CotJA [Alicyclobacillus cellulosilyticus]
MDAQWRTYTPWRSPFDPCPPREQRAYIVPPNQFIQTQPRGLRQFAPREALRRGTLWPDLYSPYDTAGRGAQP